VNPALAFPAVPGLNHGDKYLLPRGGSPKPGGVEVCDVALPVLAWAQQAQVIGTAGFHPARAARRLPKDHYVFVGGPDVQPQPNSVFRVIDDLQPGDGIGAEDYRGGRFLHRRQTQPPQGAVDLDAKLLPT